MTPDLLRKFKSVSSSRKIELLVTFFVLITIVYFHATNLHYGGSLIRDETNSVKLASRPLISGIHDDLMYDSFPPFSIVVFHLWGLIAASDYWFRVLGFLIGMAILAAFWINSRLIGLGIPLLSLAIFELNYTAVRYGDYVRAHSLGIFFILAVFGLIWKLTTTPGHSWKIFAMATLVAVLSVQTTYQNAFLLLAICLGGVVVAYTHQDWEKIWSIIAVGLIAALSLVPYEGFIRRANDWSSVGRPEYDPNAIWPVIHTTLGISGPIFILILIGLVACGILFFFVLPSRNEISANRKDLFNFSIVTLFTGSIGFLIFLQRIRLPPQTYYFIPLLAIVAVCLESIFVALISSDKLQKILKVFGVLVFLFLTVQPNLQSLRIRTTNIDIIANRLPALAGKNDLILVNPWLIGVSFERYYKGQTPWLTLPPLNDLSIFRYDLLKEKIAEENPLGPALASIQKTLSSGGQVWLIGNIDSSTEKKPTGSFMDPYLEHWTWQLGQLMYQHAVKRKTIDLHINQEINSYENFPLSVFQGWQQ